MKNKKQKEKEAIARLAQAGIKAFTHDQVFSKYSKNKAFQRAYQEEMQRIDLVRQIRQLRTEHRLTQRAVAVKSGMTQSVIARIESGEHAISLDTLGKIAHALGKKVSLV